MGLIFLEAMAALAVFVLIVWWTMFSGRKGGEPDHGDEDPETSKDKATHRKEEQGL